MTKGLAILLRVLLALGLVFCVLALVGGTLADRAVDPRQMLQKFQRFADASANGVEPEAYPALAEAMLQRPLGVAASRAWRLAGWGLLAAALWLALAAPGWTRGLVALSGHTSAAAALVLLALVLISYLLLRKRQTSLFQAIAIDRAMLWAALLWMALLAVVGVWALVDFQGLFYGLHWVAFTNDLWLLDPGHDLLLQLMPLELFISYAWDLLKQNAFVLLVLPLAAFGLRAARKAA